MNVRSALYASLFLLGNLVAPSFAQLGALDKLLRGATESTTKKIAYFKIDGPVVETPTELPPFFADKQPIALKSILEGLKEARADSGVVAIVLDLEGASIGLAQLEELCDAMRKTIAADKEIFINSDGLTTASYIAAGGASYLSLVPTGDLWLTGIYGETPYLRGALDKIGLVPDFETCGDFKTAVEPILRMGPSDQAKQMSKWLLDGLYASIVESIAQGRNMTPDKVRGLIDKGPYSAEDAKAAGLIDAVQHRQDFLAEVKKRYGSAEIVADYGEDDDMKVPEDPFGAMTFFFSKITEMMNPSPKSYDKPSVGIVYVEGAIDVGEREISPFGMPSGAFSTTIRKALNKAAEDSSVKAVVLRVDSPGGSALASEIIWDAGERVAKKKPFIVSMGNVAGSGGYYVACGAETIFADKMTITGSIGVLGGKLVTTDMWKKLGINWHAEQRGERAGILSSATPFNESERVKMRQYMDSIYGVFKKHVTDGRGKKLTKPIDEIAGGRVYTGTQALELGLVDQIGGLDEAIKFAAKKAGISDYDIRVIPDPPSLFELLLGQPRDDDEVTRVRFSPLGSSDRFANLEPFKSMLTTLGTLDPQRTRAVIQALRRLEIVHREGVITMMPEDWVIR